MSAEKDQGANNTITQSMEISPHTRADNLQNTTLIDSVGNHNNYLDETIEQEFAVTKQGSIIPEQTVPIKDGDVKSGNSRIPKNPVDAESDADSLSESDKIALYENELGQNRLRFTLVIMLVVFATSWTCLNFVLLSKQQTERPFGYDTAKNTTDTFVVTSINSFTDDEIKLGDELIGINGIPFGREVYLDLESNAKPGDRYILAIRRGGLILNIEAVAQPVSQTWVLGRYVLALLLPILFLTVGTAVFLLKPNNKPALLLVVAFSCLSMAIALDSNSYFINQLPSVLNFLFRAGNALGMFCFAVLLHLFLVFPQRLNLVKRFPAIEYLIYLPSLFFIFIPFLTADLYLTGWIAVNFFSRGTLLTISFITMGLNLLLALTALLFGYFQANITEKHRIQFIAIGFALIAAPNGLIFTLGKALDYAPGEWAKFFMRLSPIILPLTFAYAIAKHKVIPVSLIVRRSLQYLFAKNALRLLLVLPILGVFWNIIANPERTLGQIILNNSVEFYAFLALAVGFFLLNQYRLSEWIDRRFFREQYNQDRLLRELIDRVKESDSMSKLSNLVNSQIQAALHPTSIHFFYEDTDESNFSSTYITSEKSENLRLPLDSPILRFMQNKREAVNFPLPVSDELPAGERLWLNQIGANLLVPMHGADGKLAGFFSLGEKMSEIPYTNQDKKLLETLASQIAIVHENLHLKERMQREQKIKNEVLSRFDAGNINLLRECPRCGRCFDRVELQCPDDKSDTTFTLPVERTIENRYRLEKLLGKGGMGAVYAATDLRINRRVAVKILSGAMFGNRTALRRFEREAQTAGKLNHRNIITVFDYGILSTEGAFLVMELVAGSTLSNVLRRKGKIDDKTIVNWFAQVLDGVAAAHKSGIIHRDLKPDNIFVTRDEYKEIRLCILDFGLARFSEQELSGSVTIPGAIMGTPGYMPLEQLRGENADERSDLFAVGVMIYEALYGKRPFAGKTYQELLMAMSEDLRFEEDQPFSDFFKRGLAIDPLKRFSSAAEMKEYLIKSNYYGE